MKRDGREQTRIRLREWKQNAAGMQLLATIRVSPWQTTVRPDLDTRVVKAVPLASPVTPIQQTPALKNM